MKSNLSLECRFIFTVSLISGYSTMTVKNLFNGICWVSKYEVKTNKFCIWVDLTFLCDGVTIYLYVSICSSPLGTSCCQCNFFFLLVFQFSQGFVIKILLCILKCLQVKDLFGLEFEMLSISDFALRLLFFFKSSTVCSTHRQMRYCKICSANSLLQY